MVLQLYREEGFYLERTVHYVSRVGLEYCKSKVVNDAENRKALYERLQFSLSGEPDPWQANAEKLFGVTPKKEFETVAV